MNVFQANSLDILDPIRERFGLLLRGDLKAVHLIHEKQDCYLVVVTQDGDSEGKIDQINLDFIDDKNGKVFTTENSIFENARLLVEEFDNVSIINCTPLLTEAASELIEYKFEYPDAKSN